MTLDLETRGLEHHRLERRVIVIFSPQCHCSPTSFNQYDKYWAISSISSSIVNKGIINYSFREGCVVSRESQQHWAGFSGNKIHCSPRDQSLSVKYSLIYELSHIGHFASSVQNGSRLTYFENKTKQKQNLKTALRFQRSRATAVNISRVTVNCFPFDVIVLAMLPAHDIWRETVSLLDVMWSWTSQWMGAL